MVLRCDKLRFHPSGRGGRKNNGAPPRYRWRRAQVPRERRQGDLRGDPGQRGYGSEERLHGLTNQVRARPEMGGDQRRNRLGTLNKTVSKGASWSPIKRKEQRCEPRPTRPRRERRRRQPGPTALPLYGWQTAAIPGYTLGSLFRRVRAQLVAGA